MSGIILKDGSPQVQLSGGILEGKQEISRGGRPFSSFIGIKYASYPERFAEAQLCDDSWDGVKKVIKMGPKCVQSSMVPREDGGMTAGQEEDCLNLNVHVPVTTAKDLNVMVWFHGGGFFFGDGYSYGPHFFMDEDVIIVTVNYRLGVFGFLSTGDEVVPGNNGLKDSIVALKWIQKNIKNFGGAPEKITIFGESAGAGITHYLMLTEKSKGLFNRSISQSGTALNNWAYSVNPKKIAVELAKYMKCPSKTEDPSSQEILDFFSKADMKVLNEAAISFKKSWPPGAPAFSFGPTAEPSVCNETELTPFISESPFVLLKKGKLQNIPWMVGMTVDEGACSSGPLLLSEKKLEELDLKWEELAPKAFNFSDLVEVKEQPVVARKLKDFYFGGKPIGLETRDGLTNLYSDEMFNYGIHRAAKEMKEVNNNVYLYQYAYEGPHSVFMAMIPFPDKENKRVMHADDITPLFDMEPMAESLGFPKEVTKLLQPGKDEEFSKRFVKLIVSFAVDGKPTYNIGGSGECKWEPLDGKDELVFYKINENPEPIKDPYLERMQFWDGLYADHFDKILIKGSPNSEGKKESKL